MQSMLLKCIPQNGGEPVRHVSATVVRSKGIVTKIAGAEVASYDLADMDNTGQLELFGYYPISEMSLSPNALQIDIEFRRSLGSARPLSVECPAFSNGTQEFFSAPAGRLFEAIIFQVGFSESHSGHQTV